MSAPTTEIGLALEAMELGSTYTGQLGKVRPWAAPIVATMGPETYLEFLEDLLGSWGWAVALPWFKQDLDTKKNWDYLLNS